MTRLGMLILNHVHSKIFSPSFSLCEIVSTYKKSGYFNDLLWRYGWLKNSAISLAKNILANINGINIFLNMGLVEEHSNWHTQQIHYRINSVKIKDQIFQWIQKALFLAHFWSIFPISGAKKNFQKIRVCHTQLHIGF